DEEQHPVARHHPLGLLAVAAAQPEHRQALADRALEIFGIGADHPVAARHLTPRVARIQEARARPGRGDAGRPWPASPPARTARPPAAAAVRRLAAPRAGGRWAPPASVWPAAAAAPAGRS